MWNDTTKMKSLNLHAQQGEREKERERCNSILKWDSEWDGRGEIKWDKASKRAKKTITALEYFKYFEEENKRSRMSGRIEGEEIIAKCDSA